MRSKEKRHWKREYKLVDRKNEKKQGERTKRQWLIMKLSPRQEEREHRL